MSILLGGGLSIVFYLRDPGIDYQGLVPGSSPWVLYRWRSMIRPHSLCFIKRGAIERSLGQLEGEAYARGYPSDQIAACAHAWFRVWPKLGVNGGSFTPAVAKGIVCDSLTRRACSHDRDPAARIRPIMFWSRNHRR